MAIELNEAGLSAARRLAGWEIGDPSWADMLTRAYLDPAETNTQLDAEEVPERTGVYR